MECVRNTEYGDNNQTGSSDNLYDMTLTSLLPYIHKMINQLFTYEGRLHPCLSWTGPALWISRSLGVWASGLHPWNNDTVRSRYGTVFYIPLLSSSRPVSHYPNPPPRQLLTVSSYHKSAEIMTFTSLAKSRRSQILPSDLLYGVYHFHQCRSQSSKSPLLFLSP